MYCTTKHDKHIIQLGGFFGSLNYTILLLNGSTPQLEASNRRCPKRWDVLPRSVFRTPRSGHVTNEKKWVTSCEFPFSLKNNENYFTSNDPHHGIYTFSYWQIFWHSIWHIFWHMFWHIFWHSIWQIFWHSI